MAIQGFEKLKVDNQTESPQILSIFRDLTDIPRPSGNESAALAFIESQLPPNCTVEKDSYGNTAFHIPASKGYESRPRIVMQGHVDMVCIGGNDDHPVNASVSELDGKQIIVGNEQTLGADNGAAGIAIPLAIINNPDFEHGPITYLLTVDEEAGLKGAKNLDPKLIPDDTAIFINLDSEEGPAEIFKGCAGGARISAEFSIGEREKLPASYEIFSISIVDCAGGHSGLDIHRNHPNAIKELNDLLLEILKEGIEFALIDFNGGETGNSIPMNATANIAIPTNQADRIKALTTSKREKKGLDVRTTMKKGDDCRAVSQDVRNKLFEALKSLPQGPLETDGDQIVTSNNVALLRTVDNAFSLLTMARSASNASLDEYGEQIQKQLISNGAKITELNKYYGWLEEEYSRAIQIAYNATREVLGRNPSIKIMHAGLECGTISERIAPRKVPMVSIGPRIKKVHNKGEYLVVEDLFTICQIVKNMLSQILQ